MIVMGDEEIAHEPLLDDKLGFGDSRERELSLARGSPVGGLDTPKTDSGRLAQKRLPPGELDAESRRRLREMTLLYRISTLLASSADVDDALYVVCRELAVYLGVPQAGFALLNAQRTAAEVIADVHPPGSPSALGSVIPVADNASMVYILAHRVPLAIGQAQTDPRLAPVHRLLQQRRVHSILIVPVMVERDVIGTLGFDAYEPHFFSAADVELVQHVANQAGQWLMRKRAQEEIRRLKEFNEEIVRNVIEGIVVQDVDGLFTFVNPAAATLLGYAPEDLLHQLPTVIVPPEYVATVQAADERRRRGLSDRYMLELVRRDGTRVPVLVSGTPRFEVDTGAFAGTLAVFTDISQQVEVEKSLADRAREMLALYELSLEISSQPNLTKLLNAVIQRAAELVGVSMGGLYLKQADGELLELVVSHNMPARYQGSILRPGEGLAGRVAQTGKPRIVENYQQWHGRARSLRQESFGRILGVPLKVRDRVIGVLNLVDDQETGSFTSDQIRLASLFADQAAIAVENARLLEAERAACAQAEALRLAAQALGASLEVGEILRSILDQLRRVLVYDTASVATMGQADSPGLFVGRGYDDEASVREHVGRLLQQSPILRRMAHDLQPVVCPDVCDLEGWIWVPGAEHVRSWMAIPLVVHWPDRQGSLGEMIGVLMADHSQPAFYDQADLHTAEALAQHAAQALENALLFAEMERLKAFNERIVQGVAEGLLIEDGEGAITFVNPAMEEMLGVSSRHLVGCHWTAIVPEDRVEPIQAQLALRSRGVGGRYETELLADDGRRVPVVVSATPLLEGGRFSGVLSAFTDITQRVQAEREIEERRRYLEAVLGAAPDAVVTLDPSFRIVEWNPGAEALFGYTRQEVIGRELDPLITDPDTRAEAEALTHRVMAGQELHPTSAVRYTKDGTPVDLLLAGSPIKVGDESIGIVGVYADVSELKRAEAQRDASLDALRKANRRLRLVSECNATLSRARQPADLLLQICQIVTETGGYPLAWVGYTERDQVGLVRPVAHACPEQGRKAASSGLPEESPTMAAGFRGDTATPAGSADSDGDHDRRALAGAGILPDSEPIVAAVRTHEIVIARDHLAPPGYGSLIALPLLSGGRCLGVLAVGAADADAFESDEVQLLSELADNLAFGILALQARMQRRWAEEVTRRYADRLEVLRRIDRAILEAQSPEAIARATLERIEHLLPCREANIFVFGAEASRPTLLASRVEGNPQTDHTSALEELETAADFRGGKAHVVTDVGGPRLPQLRPPGSDRPMTGGARVRQRLPSGGGGSDARGEDALDGLAPRGMGSALYIPLIAEGELVGAIYLASDQPDAFDDEKIEIGYEVAAPLAVAIQHARLHQQLQRHAENLEEAIAQRTRELKAERDRTQAILESLGEAVIVTDVDGKILYTNPATTVLTGYAAEEILGQNWAPLLDGEDGRGRFEQARDTLLAGDTWRAQTISQRKDDVLYDAAVTAAPLFDPDVPHQLIGSAWVQRDISPLREAERFKDRFVSNVSHELRTPLSILTLVAGNLDRLYSGLDDAKRQEMIKTLREQAGVLSELVGDVLEISRIDSGQVSRERRSLDLAQLVREEMDKQWPLAQRRALTLRSAGVESLAATGNAAQLRQVIRNLLNNAIKFTPEGGQITCECRAHSAGEDWGPGWPGSAGLPPGAWAAVRVVDTGVGINREDLPHIFERFYRVHPENDIPGTGLGLAIARELVDLHDGHLAVASTAHLGSTFAFYLRREEGS